MTQNDALEALLIYPDHKVQAAAQIIKESLHRKQRVLGLVQEAISQMRLDVKYLVFDLECTRKERDQARGVA